MVANSFAAAPRALVIAMRGKRKHDTRNHYDFNERFARTLHIWGNHCK
jgi:hypothetical protein